MNIFIFVLYSIYMTQICIYTCICMYICLYIIEISP